MHILMLAPEPFFEPRGTPFSEYHRIRALGDLGHTVDLVTYPFGKDVSLPGLRVFRCLKPPFLKSVRIGPSFAKIPLDAALTLTAVRRAFAGRYDAVHSHEEAGVIGVLIARALGVPHLYDMHSSLPQQLDNFNFTRSRLLVRAFQAMERFVLKHSRVVIVICPHLQSVVREVDPDTHSVLIENAPGSGDAPTAGAGAAVRQGLKLDEAAPVILYTGTFEAYQGLDLLFDSMPHVVASRPDARLVVAGGQPDQVAEARRQVAARGLERAVVFAGQRPADEIPAYLDAADVLVSPRSTGWNTPLKIYQYLRSGRPIVATRLLTHTQVLDEDVAILTEPTPPGFAAGILRAIGDPAEAAAIGRRALALAETKYTYDAYMEKTRAACSHLFGTGRPEVAQGIA
jgi:glycosyltransferase involved in cell wall biosynthesis